MNIRLCVGRGGGVEEGGCYKTIDEMYIVVVWTDCEH